MNDEIWSLIRIRGFTTSGKWQYLLLTASLLIIILGGYLANR